MRIGFSRAYSSRTSALSPATRPTMNISLPTVEGKPRSTRIAASAPSMFSGMGLMRFRTASSSARREADAVAGDTVLLRQCEQDGDAWVDDGVHAMSETGQARLRGSGPPRRAARPCPRTTCRSRAVSRPAAINSMQPEPAPPCSSPIVSTPAAIAAESDCRLPDAASRAAAQDGAPAPWSATPIRIASSSRRSPGDGSRCVSGAGRSDR